MLNANKYQNNIAVVLHISSPYRTTNIHADVDYMYIQLGQPKTAPSSYLYLVQQYVIDMNYI